MEILVDKLDKRACTTDGVIHPYASVFYHEFIAASNEFGSQAIIDKDKGHKDRLLMSILDKMNVHTFAEAKAGDRLLLEAKLIDINRY